MMIRSILALSAAAALLSPGAARASATGQVTIGQFTYTLTDLDPNDGITPSIVFQPLGPDQFVPASIGIGYDRNGVAGSANVHATAYEPVTSSVDVPGRSLSGSASGSLDPATISLDAFASADETGGYSGDASISLSSAYLGFVLSPNTALNLSAVAHFTAHALPDGQVDRLTSDAWISMRGQDQNGYFVTDFTPAYIFSYGNDAPVDSIGQLSGTYTNNSAASVSGSLHLSADVWAVAVGGQVSPVPEPGQAAMVGAGLPLLFMLRRRARRRAGA